MGTTSIDIDESEAPLSPSLNILLSLPSTVSSLFDLSHGKIHCFQNSFEQYKSHDTGRNKSSLHPASPDSAVANANIFINVELVQCHGCIHLHLHHYCCRMILLAVFAVVPPFQS